MEKTVSRNPAKFLIFSIIGILYFFVPLAPSLQISVRSLPAFTAP